MVPVEEVVVAAAVAAATTRIRRARTTDNKPKAGGFCFEYLKTGKCSNGGHGAVCKNKKGFIMRHERPHTKAKFDALKKKYAKAMDDLDWPTCQEVTKLPDDAA